MSNSPFHDNNPINWLAIGKVGLHFIGLFLATFLVAWGGGVEALPAVKVAAVAAGTYVLGLMQAKPQLRSNGIGTVSLPPKP